MPMTPDPADVRPDDPASSRRTFYRILWARGLRDFGDGNVAVLLPLYLAALGYGAVEVGIASTLALFGSAVMTLGAGMVGARIAPRMLLMFAAALMIATGLGFAVAHSFTIIAIMAVVGTINPSAGSVSIFAPLEQTLLTQAVPARSRTAAFARYSLVGALAAAGGALCAAIPEALSGSGLSQLASFQVMFVLYACLGLAAGFAYRGIPILPDHVAEDHRAPLGPSRRIVIKLAGLFCIDSFAGGFAVQALLALWLFDRFALSLAEAGLFFFWSGVLSAFSFPVAAWLSQRIGLVNTMVFTHIPSSLCVIAATFAPTVEIALGLLLVRSALSQMDVPTRTSYVMAVVTPAERSAAASFTAVPRSLAAAASPALAGVIYASGFRAAPFIICGVLKIAYDLVLLWSFRHVKPPEEVGPSR